MILHTYLDPESPFRFWVLRCRGRIIARRPKGLIVIPVFVCSIWGMQGLNLCLSAAAFWLLRANFSLPSNYLTLTLPEAGCLHSITYFLPTF